MKKVTIEVNQDENKSVCYPDVITSGGFWPCIAVGVIDKIGRKAYMIHEANASIDNNLPGFIESILEKHLKQNLEVWIIGGGVLKEEDESDANYVSEQREYVEEVVKNYFLENQLFIRWSGNKFSELVIDTETNEVRIELYD